MREEQPRAYAWLDGNEAGALPPTCNAGELTSAVIVGSLGQRHCPNPEAFERTRYRRALSSHSDPQTWAGR